MSSLRLVDSHERCDLTSGHARPLSPRWCPFGHKWSHVMYMMSKLIYRKLPVKAWNLPLALFLCYFICGFHQVITKFITKAFIVELGLYYYNISLIWKFKILSLWGGWVFTLKRWKRQKKSKICVHVNTKSVNNLFFRF